MAQLLTAPYTHLEDLDGNPLSGGLVYFYSAGTTTPKNTYTDFGGLTPAPNPVVLDSGGNAAIWVNGFYKVIVKTSAGVTLYTVDSVSASPSGGNMTTAVYDPSLIQEQFVGINAIQTVANKTFAGGTNLGTPVSGDLSNCTNAPAGNLTGAITSTGLATSLGSFTSANLRAALTDESGTGAALFAGGNIGAATATSINFGQSALSFYQEGNWTPADGSAALLSFASATGVYTRIGRVVFANFNITYPTTASGVAAAIGGLPFNVGTGVTGGLGPSFTQVDIRAQGNAGAATFNLYGATGAAVTNVSLTGKIIQGQFIYSV